MVEQKYSKLAINSFLLMIFSLIFLGFFPFLNMLFVITLPLSIILGVISLASIKKENLKGKFLAIAGIGLSVLLILSLIFITFIISPFPNHDYNDRYFLEPEAPNATTLNPLTLSRFNIIMSGDMNTALRANLFNANDYNVSNAELMAQCPLLPIKLQSQNKLLLSNSSTSFQLMLFVNASNLKPSNYDKYLCTLCVNDGSNACRNDFNNTDFIIEMK